MTTAHGRHMGIVRGGRSRRRQPDLQPSNHVDLVWRARLDEHLGMFQVEVLQHNAARLFEQAVGVFGFQAAAAHLRLLPERDPHPHLFQTLALMLEHFDDPQSAGELFIRFEFQLLNELGFGLDLETCAATGTGEDLIYVSPKSGRAVSREAGLPYADRLLPLPAFLKPGSGQRADAEAFDKALRLAGFFFSRHVWEPRGIREPDERGGFYRALMRHLAQTDPREG